MAAGLVTALELMGVGATPLPAEEAAVAVTVASAPESIRAGATTYDTGACVTRACGIG
jgi:hypothetical protein